jgi:hypothetical protein
MKLQLDITSAGGTHAEVTVDPLTQVLYERQYKVHLGDGDIGMEGIYWMAWKAQKIPVPFDTWLGTIEAVKALPQPEEDGDADPLDTGQSYGDTLPSPSSPGLRSTG